MLVAAVAMASQQPRDSKKLRLIYTLAAKRAPRISLSF